MLFVQKYYTINGLICEVKKALSKKQVQSAGSQRGHRGDLETLCIMRNFCKGGGHFAHGGNSGGSWGYGDGAGGSTDSYGDIIGIQCIWR